MEKTITPTRVKWELDTNKRTLTIIYEGETHVLPFKDIDFYFLEDDDVEPYTYYETIDVENGRTQQVRTYDTEVVLSDILTEDLCEDILESLVF